MDVGVSLVVATLPVASLGGVGGGADSATVAVGPASAVTGADILCGNGFGVVITDADGVACGAADGGSGDSAVVTGSVATVDVTGGGFVSVGGSEAAVADGTTVTEGASEVGADGMSRTSIGFGACVAGFGGLTGVVDGPVAGSANAGAIPPVSAVSEIAVPVASTTTNPRPRQVRLIGSWFPLIADVASIRNPCPLCQPPPGHSQHRMGVLLACRRRCVSECSIYFWGDPPLLNSQTLGVCYVMTRCTSCVTSPPS